MKYLDIVIQKQLNRPLHKHMDSSCVSNIKDSFYIGYMQVCMDMEILMNEVFRYSASETTE